PLEDFAYVVGAVLLLPALWYLLPARRASQLSSNEGEGPR
ncbi:MAG: hypothetical protein JWR01_1048, partial [Subtercola sp.]|nr:hypothetical protein [Subtercola sp.]